MSNVKGDESIMLAPIGRECREIFAVSTDERSENLKGDCEKRG